MVRTVLGKTCCEPLSLYAAADPPYPRETASAPAYSEFSSNGPPDHGDDVLAVTSAAHHPVQHPPMLPLQGPRLVTGTVTMDDVSFITKINLNCDPAAAQLSEMPVPPA